MFIDMENKSDIFPCFARMLNPTPRIALFLPPSVRWSQKNTGTSDWLLPLGRQKNLCFGNRSHRCFNRWGRRSPLVKKHMKVDNMKVDKVKVDNIKVDNMKVDNMKVDNMKVDMVVDLVVSKVGNMKVDMVADIEVDLVVGKAVNRVAHMVAHMDVSIIFWSFLTCHMA